MTNSPFNRMTQRARGHTRLLLSVIPFSLILLGALLVGSQQFMTDERRHLSSDFLVTLAYIEEQERFLIQLHKNANKQQAGSKLKPYSLSPGQSSTVWQFTSNVPFSVICTDACPPPPNDYIALGSRLADSFASFWALSYFPSNYLFLFHPDIKSGLTIPTLDVSRNSKILSVDAHNAAQRYAQTVSLPHLPSQQVNWISLPGHPFHMLGVTQIAAPGVPSSNGNHSFFQAVSLFDKRRLREFINQAEAPIGYRFWLSHNDQGVLIGQNAPPKIERNGFALSLQGLAFKIQDPSGAWTGYYLISPSQLVNNSWVPTGTVLFLLLSLLGGVAYARWYGLSVVRPAHEAQHALLESHQFNRQVIDTSPVALCVISQRDRRIIFSNAQALDYLCLTVGDCLPKGNKLSDTLDKFLTQEKTEFEKNNNKLDLPDGRSLHVACAASRYHNQDVLLCVLMDLTAQEEIQRELKRARAAADESSTAKSAFLATMSHEIRTPLYGVLGSLELLSMTELNSQQYQQVDRIQGASHQLLQIISDILDISRIEAGQTQVQIQALDPVTLVQECTATFAAMAQQKNLLLFCAIDSNSARSVLGDPLHIRQILNNLINNAIKFTQAGHIIVRLRQEHDQAGQVQLLFQVSDSGVGIDKERHDKLFTPFYVAHSGEHIIRGAGLGLSICARLAELMGSQILLTSAPGLGSSFSFTLTLERTTTLSLATTAQPSLQGMRLLVRSPHAELSDSICQWLKRWGAIGHTWLPSEPLHGDPEEVLLDIMMPAQGEKTDWAGPYFSISPREGLASLPEADSTNPESIGRALQNWHDSQNGNTTRSTSTPKAKAAHASRPGMHVLVAEDNPLNQATLREQLERLGCQVTLAQDGDEALGLWDQDQHDLLLTDVNMPNLNGYELTRHLRAQGELAPIVGITANAMSDEEQRCKESGMNACLVKPINLAALEALLNTLRLSPVPRRYRSIFRQTISADLQTLEQALHQQDTPIILAVLHRLAGALAVMGLQESADSIRELEQNFRQNNNPPEKLDKTATAVCAELHDLIERV